MFDGTGIDTEVGLIMVIGGFTWIAVIMVGGAMGSLIRRIRGRKK